MTKIIAGVNDLQTINPSLASQWDYEKNYPLTPEQVTPNSHKDVWWICHKGHSWKARIQGRHYGRGCPECGKEKKTSFPEQAILFYLTKCTDTLHRNQIYGKEIDIYLPLLKIGIEYNGKYYHQNRKDKDREKINFFQEKGIKIIVIEDGEYNTLCDNLITYKEQDAKKNNLQWVIIELFNMIGIIPPNIDIIAHSSEIYSQYIQLEKSNSFANKYPHIATEWHPTKNGNLTPDMVSCNSAKKVWWLGECGHEWQAVVHSRASGKACPYCSGRKVLIGINDFATLHPELLDEWDYVKNKDLLPTQVTAMSNKKVWWKCKTCGHEWKTTIASRSSGRGCKQCYQQNFVGVNNPKAKPIEQYDLDGNFVREWEYIKQAENALNIKYIGPCINGKSKSAGGFIWKAKNINEPNVS